MVLPETVNIFDGKYFSVVYVPKGATHSLLSGGIATESGWIIQKKETAMNIDGYYYLDMGPEKGKRLIPELHGKSLGWVFLSVDKEAHSGDMVAVDDYQGDWQHIVYEEVAILRI